MFSTALIQSLILKSGFLFWFGGELAAVVLPNGLRLLQNIGWNWMLSVVCNPEVGLQ